MPTTRTGLVRPPRPQQRSACPDPPRPQGPALTSLLTVPLSDLPAAQTRRVGFSCGPSCLTESQGSTGRGLGAAAPAWSRAARPGPRTRLPATRSLPARSDAAPATRRTVPTPAPNSRPRPVPAAGSLPLPPGDAPAVKRGARCCKALTTEPGTALRPAAAPAPAVSVGVSGAEPGGRLPVCLPRSVCVPRRPPEAARSRCGRGGEVAHRRLPAAIIPACTAAAGESAAMLR